MPRYTRELREGDPGWVRPKPVAQHVQQHLQTHGFYHAGAMARKPAGAMARKPAGAMARKPDGYRSQPRVAKRTMADIEAP